MSCWRRLHACQQVGVWQRMHETTLQRLRKCDQIQWERASIDSASVFPLGGQHTGPNPTDRGKLGCKHPLLADQRGLPLVASISGTQLHDSRMLIALLEAVPRKRPAKLHADKAYASRAHRAWLRSRGIAPRIARYGIESRERLGKWRRLYRRGAVHWASCLWW
jgi:hypothetical protein